MAGLFVLIPFTIASTLNCYFKANISYIKWHLSIISLSPAEEKLMATVPFINMIMQNIKLNSLCPISVINDDIPN